MFLPRGRSSRDPACRPGRAVSPAVLRAGQGSWRSGLLLVDACSHRALLSGSSAGALSSRLLRLLPAGSWASAVTSGLRACEFRFWKWGLGWGSGGLWVDTEGSGIGHRRLGRELRSEARWWPPWLLAPSEWGRVLEDEGSGSPWEWEKEWRGLTMPLASAGPSPALCHACRLAPAPADKARWPDAVAGALPGHIPPGAV